MMFLPFFYAFANNLGHFQWLTCPRKVSAQLIIMQSKKHACAIFNDAQNEGLIDWLASL